MISTQYSQSPSYWGAFCVYNLTSYTFFPYAFNEIPTHKNNGKKLEHQRTFFQVVRKWRLTVMHIQLPNWDLGLWDYLGFKSISYCTRCYIGGEGEVHNCCVDWASRIVKYNVNKGSIACKSLLYEGDCDCRNASVALSICNILYN